MEFLYSYTFFESNGGMIIFGLIFILIGLVCLVLEILTYKDNDRATNGAALFIICLALIGGGWTVVDTTLNPYKEYDVAIKDMSQYDTNKYVVVNQRGNIFKIRELPSE